MSTIQPPAVKPQAATVIVSLPAGKIFFCNAEGWSLKIADGDILGRTNGPHSGQLGKYPVISSDHARVTRKDNAWFITDMVSTNKTFLNGTKLEPNIPAAIKQDDVVTLANIKFTVSLS